METDKAEQEWSTFCISTKKKVLFVCMPHKHIGEDKTDPQRLSICESSMCHASYTHHAPIGHFRYPQLLMSRGLDSPYTSGPLSLHTSLSQLSTHSHSIYHIPFPNTLSHLSIFSCPWIRYRKCDQLYIYKYMRVLCCVTWVCFFNPSIFFFENLG